MTNESRKNQIAQKIDEIIDEFQMASCLWFIQKGDSRRDRVEAARKALTDCLVYGAPTDSAPREEECIGSIDHLAKWIMEPDAPLVPTPATEGEGEPVGYLVDNYQGPYNFYFNEDKAQRSVTEAGGSYFPVFRKPPAPVEEVGEEFLSNLIRLIRKDTMAPYSLQDMMVKVKAYMASHTLVPPAPVSPVAPVVAGSGVVERLLLKAVEVAGGKVIPRHWLEFQKIVETELVTLPEPTPWAKLMIQNATVGTSQSIGSLPMDCRRQIAAALLSPEAEGGR